MSNPKLLIVEDEGIVALDIHRSLINLGYEVLDIVDNGEEAIEKALSLQPDLVLMDIRLIGPMDGIEAAGIISQHMDIPIIYLTAFADDDTLERAKLTGPFGYILKPFEEKELHTTIEIALYKHKLERELKDQKQWLATILRSIGEAIIATNVEGRITFMNIVAEQLTGWKQEEVVGRELTEVIKFIHEETRIALKSPVEEALQEGSVVISSTPMVLIGKDSIEIPIEQRTAPIKDDNGNVRGAVLVLRDITQHKQVQAQLIRYAFHDGLTDLPNRTLLMERLQNAFERSKRCSQDLFGLLFLDLDRFKVINESFGHAIGDQLLIAIAQRLRESLRVNDTVARMGGDEFAILLEHIPDASVACRTAERILNELSAPLMVEGQEVFLTASIGIVMGIDNFSSQSYPRIEDLIRDAEIAMYRAKSLGKNRYEVFDTVIHAQITALLQLENDLRGAIERREFQIYYQPIVSLSTGTISGFEALVRWNHPTRGLIAPDQFIPVAEETGLIILIDWWVLYEASRQTRHWQEQFPTNPPLTISINLSSKQFAQPNLIEQIEKTLLETSLDPHNLKLEITESAIIENMESAIIILSHLKAKGIQIYIDDFGTGYSSLSYLHRFPIDTLKIDRSFIINLATERENLEIIRAILMLAHSLGMNAIAEGVETQEQFVKIRELQCEYGQGYFFSQALDNKAATALIAAKPSYF